MCSRTALLKLRLRPRPSVFEARARQRRKTGRTQVQVRRLCFAGIRRPTNIQWWWWWWWWWSYTVNGTVSNNWLSGINILQNFRRHRSCFFQLVNGNKIQHAGKSTLCKFKDLHSMTSTREKLAVTLTQTGGRWVEAKTRNLQTYKAKVRAMKYCPPVTVVL